MLYGQLDVHEYYPYVTGCYRSDADDADNNAIADHEVLPGDGQEHVDCHEIEEGEEWNLGIRAGLDRILPRKSLRVTRKPAGVYFVESIVVLDGCDGYQGNFKDLIRKNI